jgi:tetratricopeptide (TPR) repeat protein
MVWAGIKRRLNGLATPNSMISTRVAVSASRSVQQPGPFSFLPMSDTATKAVFLSYASQDAEAARRICEALRSGGVEVWFDAEGGLEHGDEWDQKIRRQIKECVLFIPVISARTQARQEGYFRIEWELAAQRALGIASGVPFILPVVIDDTREPGALVPDRFRMVQWTRLPGGGVSPEVQARLLKLWSHRTGTLKHEASESAAQITSALIGKSAFKTYVLPAAVIAVAIAGTGWWMYHRGASGPTQAAVSPASPSEADQLLRQARELIYDPDSARNEFALAENLLKRATDLEPTSGAAWGASALLNYYFFSRTYDPDPQRKVRSESEAEKALLLDRNNADALLALGLLHQSLGETDRARDYLDRAHAADPLNFKVILAQSLFISDFYARAKFLENAAAHVSRPAELFYYAAFNLHWAGRHAEAAVECERAIKAQPFWRTFVARADIECQQTADPVKITAWLDKVPELKRDEPRVAFMRYEVAMLRRDGAEAARVLSTLAADYLLDTYFTGPKAYFLAQAQELAGRPELAAEQWQFAERTVREKLEVEPGTIVWRTMLAGILAGENRPVEAKAIADSCAADERLKGNSVAAESLAYAYARLGEPLRAIAILQGLQINGGGGYVSAATLAVDPQWDSLRSLPEYRLLVDRFKRADNENLTGATSK